MKTAENVMSDFEAVNGQRRKFAEITEQRRTQLLWLAQRMTNSREEAEDVVQEALLKAYKNLGQFRGDSQMGTWISVIVQNTGREWLRRQKRRIHLPLEEVRDRDEEPQTLELTDPAESPELSCVRREMAGMMFTEIAALNSVCKTALEMCALKEQSHAEVAQALGVNVFTIKSRIFHGKRMLKRAMARRIGSEQVAAGII